MSWLGVGGHAHKLWFVFAVAQRMVRRTLAFCRLTALPVGIFDDNKALTNLYACSPCHKQISILFVFVLYPARVFDDFWRDSRAPQKFGCPELEQF